MIRSAILLLGLFTYINSSYSTCVMQGVCGMHQDHVCRPVNLSYVKVTKKISNFCYKYPIHSNCCCTEHQVAVVEQNLVPAKRWFGGKCYDLLRELFCDMHCSAEQDVLISDVIVDKTNAITSFTFAIRETDVNKLFSACKDKTFFFIRLVNQVCIKYPCDAKEFIRSIGTIKHNGGRSPFQINFKFI